LHRRLHRLTKIEPHDEDSHQTDKDGHSH
jgi:hypothetical protein